MRRAELGLIKVEDYSIERSHELVTKTVLEQPSILDATVGAFESIQIAGSDRLSFRSHPKHRSPAFVSGRVL